MDKDTFTQVVELIKQVGFPIVTCVWFMWRFEKRLEALTTAINNLKEVAKCRMSDG